MAKMTAKEKKLRAQVRKELREDGILPPIKSPLNRRKFLNETQSEWEAREISQIWDIYLLRAVFYMITHTERHHILSPSLEAVGAAKILKIAMRLQQFQSQLQQEERANYTLMEEYEYVKDIMKL